MIESMTVYIIRASSILTSVATTKAVKVAGAYTPLADMAYTPLFQFDSLNLL